MIKIVKKHRNRIIKEPVPMFLLRFIRYCDLTLGNSYTRRYTSIVFQTNKAEFTYKGKCNQPRYRAYIYCSNHEDIFDLLDTVAHELVHIYTMHVLEVDYCDNNSAFKRENWNENKEEFLVEALAYKLVHTFVKNNLDDYKKSLNKLHKYCEIKQHE